MATCDLIMYNRHDNNEPNANEKEINEINAEKQKQKLKWEIGEKLRHKWFIAGARNAAVFTGQFSAAEIGYAAVVLIIMDVFGEHIAVSVWPRIRRAEKFGPP